MWIKQEVVEEVEAVARIFYIDQTMAQRWNQHRREHELRMMTGWCWSEKGGQQERVGLKSVTAAYIDAHLVLVQQITRPHFTRPRLRVVSDRKVA
jgi:hypothetical protein